jgi:hypothetical protein
MTLELDKNSGGVGLVLRLSGVALPTLLFFVVLFVVERGSRGIRALDSSVSGAFQVLAFLWSWPYGMYHQHPFSFGALGVVSLLMSILLRLRRDPRGWVGTLIFSFAFAWVVATIVGEAQGS